MYEKPMKFANSMNFSAHCPFCGKVFDYALYPEIHIPGDRKLKKLVLNKTLYFPKCPYCREEFKLRPNCIYHDENRKEIFIVTDLPDATFENLLKSGDIHFNNLRTEDDLMEFVKGTYKRRVVHDVDAFREKILLSDNNYDDRIIELIKLSLSVLIEKDSGKHVYRIFLEETAGSQLEFTAILGNCAPFEYATIKSHAVFYNQYRDRYLKKLGRPEEDEYISTDQKWAKNSGLLKEGDDMGFMIPM